jgi:hypothetical protein
MKNIGKLSQSSRSRSLCPVKIVPHAMFLKKEERRKKEEGVGLILVDVEEGVVYDRQLQLTKRRNSLQDHRTLKNLTSASSSPL